MKKQAHQNQKTDTQHLELLNRLLSTLTTGGGDWATVTGRKLSFERSARSAKISAICQAKDGTGRTGYGLVVRLLTVMLNDLKKYIPSRMGPEAIAAEIARAAKSIINYHASSLSLSSIAHLVELVAAAVPPFNEDIMGFNSRNILKLVSKYSQIQANTARALQAAEVKKEYKNECIIKPATGGVPMPPQFKKVLKALEVKVAKEDTKAIKSPLRVSKQPRKLDFAHILFNQIAFKLKMGPIELKTKLTAEFSKEYKDTYGDSGTVAKSEFLDWKVEAFILEHQKQFEL